MTEADLRSLANEIGDQEKILIEIMDKSDGEVFKASLTPKGALIMQNHYGKKRKIPCFRPNWEVVSYRVTQLMERW